MSGQTNKAGDGVIDEHYCEHSGCKNWGGFGYSNSRFEKPTWHCWEHYQHKERDFSARKREKPPGANRTAFDNVSG